MSEKSTTVTIEDEQLILKNQEILEERARKLALPLTQEEAVGDTIEVVSFSIGTEKFLLDSKYVLEINKLREFTPVPGTPDFVVGVTNIRGTILALIELRKFFTLPSRGLTDLTRIIVLGQEKFEIGILAEKAEQTYALRKSAILNVPDNISSGTAKYLKGVTRDAFLYLNAEVILSDDRLYIGQE